MKKAKQLKADFESGRLSAREVLRRIDRRIKDMAPAILSGELSNTEAARITHVFAQIQKRIKRKKR
jgi:hypothetical protein